MRKRYIKISKDFLKGLKFEIKVNPLGRRKCWALSNLQPLEKVDELNKGEIELDYFIIALKGHFEGGDFRHYKQ